MSSAARIMFEASGKDNTDDLYFDQIRVTGLRAPSVAAVPALSELRVAGLAAGLAASGILVRRRGVAAAWVQYTVDDV